jgi:hypothetical protein
LLLEKSDQFRYLIPVFRRCLNELVSRRELSYEDPLQSIYGGFTIEWLGAFCDDDVAISGALDLAAFGLLRICDLRQFFESTSSVNAAAPSVADIQRVRESPGLTREIERLRALLEPFDDL